MPRQEQLTNVPGGRVDKIVAQFKADGATEVTKEQQPNGNWTVTATFPD